MQTCAKCTRKENTCVHSFVFVWPHCCFLFKNDLQLFGDNNLTALFIDIDEADAIDVSIDDAKVAIDACDVTCLCSSALSSF